MQDYANIQKARIPSFYFFFINYPRYNAILFLGEQRRGKKKNVSDFALSDL